MPLDLGTNATNNIYGRIISVDVGMQYVGLARTDLLKTVASPFGTYSPPEAIKMICQQVERDNVETIVVGWPLKIDGSVGPAIKMVEQFIKRLTPKLPKQVPIEKVDERYSSKEAKATLIETGVSKKKRSEKDRIDRVAAAIILEEYLLQIS